MTGPPCDVLVYVQLSLDNFVEIEVGQWWTKAQQEDALLVKETFDTLPPFHEPRSTCLMSAIGQCAKPLYIIKKQTKTSSVGEVGFLTRQPIQLAEQ